MPLAIIVPIAIIVPRLLAIIMPPAFVAATAFVRIFAIWATAIASVTPALAVTLHKMSRVAGAR